MFVFCFFKEISWLNKKKKHNKLVGLVGLVGQFFVCFGLASVVLPLPLFGSKTIHFSGVHGHVFLSEFRCLDFVKRCRCSICF